MKILLITCIISFLLIHANKVIADEEEEPPQDSQVPKSISVPQNSKNPPQKGIKLENYRMAIKKLSVFMKNVKRFSTSLKQLAILLIKLKPKDHASKKITTEGTVNAVAFKLVSATPVPKAPYKSYVKQSFQVLKIDNCKRLTCTKAVNKVTAQTEIDAIKKSTKSGTFITGCGKNHYYIPTKKMPLNDAYGACCQIGMHLASIQTLEDMECVRKQVSKTTDIKSCSTKTVFLNSFLDIKFDHKFISCSASRPINDSLWAPNQPDNHNAESPCAVLNLCYGPEFGYDDTTCVMPPKSVLCEVPANSVLGEALGGPVPTTAEQDTPPPKVSKKKRL